MRHRETLLEEAGRHLWVSDWEPWMADALGVSDDWVARWRSGPASVPATMWSALGRLCLLRADEFDLEAYCLERELC